ncbi:MAG: hypothetical protein JJ869_09345 [Marivita sp.]|nr:hypothetical protein [Marivita sp.]
MECPPAAATSCFEISAGWLGSPSTLTSIDRTRPPCALTWRLGYRSRGALALAAIFAVAVTVTFKGFLGVNIPGGQIYELLPASVRTFFMVYL